MTNISEQLENCDSKQKTLRRRSSRMKETQSTNTGGENADSIDNFQLLFKKISQPINDHIKMQHISISANQTFKCNDCDSSFISALPLRQHVLVTHMRLEPERYECTKCGNVVTELMEHYRRHERALYRSEHCGHPFGSHKSYQAHRYTRDRETKWSCNLCGVRLLTQRKLRHHHTLHDAHRDEIGNRLTLTARMSRHPDFDRGDNADDGTRVDAQCGIDATGRCVHDDADWKVVRVLTNSKLCDTSGLEDFISGQDEPALKIRRIDL